MVRSSSIAAVIPVYNKEAHVARAIDSVLRQSRPVDEIVIVDDGSTDGSPQRIEAFRDPRIRLLRRAGPGPGPNPARNLAIRCASARWIAFLDADDEWHADFIEQIGSSIDQAPETVGCVFTGWQDVWPDGSITQDPYSASYSAPTFTHLDLERFVSAWLDLHLCPIWTSAIAIRRDILLSAGLFPERCYRGGDKDTWLRVMALTEARGSPKVCSSYYRLTENQVHRTGSSNVRHCLCPTLEEMISQSSGRRRRLLMQLFNLEVFSYAVQVGQKERISSEVYHGFHIGLDPARYGTLLALRYLPVPFQQTIRRTLLRSNRILGISRFRRAEQMRDSERKGLKVT